MPFLKSGVTLAVFQSFEYIPVRIDFENIEVREGAMILAAIFNNLLGIISTLGIVEEKNDQWALNKTQYKHRQQNILC